MIDLVEDLACGIVSILEKIRISAGFSNDVTSVERPLQKGNIGADRKIIVSSGERRPPMPGDMIPLGHDGYRVHFSIMLMVSESSETGISVDRRLNSLDADIVQALRVSFDNNGPIARIGTNQYFDSAPTPMLFNGLPAFNRSFNVLLITLLNLPNQQ